MKDEQEHRIKSLDDLVDVATEDNFENLAKDLVSWLHYNVRLFKSAREKHPKETKGKLNSELASVGFDWIDDGKNELKKVIIEDRKEEE